MIPKNPSVNYWDQIDPALGNAHTNWIDVVTNFGFGHSAELMSAASFERNLLGHYLFTKNGHRVDDVMGPVRDWSVSNPYPDPFSDIYEEVDVHYGVGDPTTGLAGLSGGTVPLAGDLVLGDDGLWTASAGAWSRPVNWAVNDYVPGFMKRTTADPKTESGCILKLRKNIFGWIAAYVADIIGTNKFDLEPLIDPQNAHAFTLFNGDRNIFDTIDIEGTWLASNPVYGGYSEVGTDDVDQNTHISTTAPDNPPDSGLSGLSKYLVRPVYEDAQRSKITWLEDMNTFPLGSNVPDPADTTEDGEYVPQIGYRHVPAYAGLYVVKESGTNETVTSVIGEDRLNHSKLRSYQWNPVAGYNADGDPEDKDPAEGGLDPATVEAYLTGEYISAYFSSSQTAFVKSVKFNGGDFSSNFTYSATAVSGDTQDLLNNFKTAYAAGVVRPVGAHDIPTDNTGRAEWHHSQFRLDAQTGTDDDAWKPATYVMIGYIKHEYYSSYHMSTFEFFTSLDGGSVGGGFDELDDSTWPEDYIAWGQFRSYEIEFAFNNMSSVHQFKNPFTGVRSPLPNQDTHIIHRSNVLVSNSNRAVSENPARPLTEHSVMYWDIADNYALTANVGDYTTYSTTQHMTLPIWNEMEDSLITTSDDGNFTLVNVAFWPGAIFPPTLDLFLTAQNISYVDPANGGVAGGYFETNPGWGNFPEFMAYRSWNFPSWRLNHPSAPDDSPEAPYQFMEGIFYDVQPFLHFHDDADQMPAAEERNYVETGR